MVAAYYSQPVLGRRISRWAMRRAVKRGEEEKWRGRVRGEGGDGRGGRMNDLQLTVRAYSIVRRQVTGLDSRTFSRRMMNMTRPKLSKHDGDNYQAV